MSDKANVSENVSITVKEDTYKGNPLLVFTSGEEDRFPFSFGLSKAKRLVAFAEANGGAATLLTTLQEFIQKHNNKKE